MGGAQAPRSRGSSDTRSLWSSRTSTGPNRPFWTSLESTSRPWPADAPLLLLCLARPELLTNGPPGAGLAGQEVAILELEPLPPEVAHELLNSSDRGADLGADDRARLLATAEGNPFFLQQMIAMRTELPEEAAASRRPSRPCSRRESMVSPPPSVPSSNGARLRDARSTAGRSPNSCPKNSATSSTRTSPR